MSITADLKDAWFTTGTIGEYLAFHSCQGRHTGPHAWILAEKLKAALDQARDSGSMIRLLEADDYADLSVVYENAGLSLLKSDIIRSRPLFYKITGDRIDVSDHVPEHRAARVGDNELAQFVAMGYVIGDRTVYEGVKALQSAEILIFENGGLKQHRTFSYQYDDEPVFTGETEPGTAGRELDRILTEIFRNTIATVPENGRLVVPLSGGHDSRIVLNYLFKLGYRNVLCYTYGVEGTLQAKISRRLAEALGYEWHFLEYTEGKWQELRDAGEFDRYLMYGFRGVGNPLISDLLPVWEMKRAGILREGDIFVPGHGLDYLSGNDLTEEDFGCETEVHALELVFRNSVRSGYLDQAREPALWGPVSRVYRESGVGPVQFHLHFFWQEDEAKFIVNSNRLYEYFGYETRLPLLDIRLIRFWLSVEHRLNIKRAFLFSLEREWLHVPEIRDIPFDREIQKKGVATPGNGFKKWIPASLKNRLLKMSGRKRVIDEGQNLIFAASPQAVEQLCGKTGNWPVCVRRLFSGDLGRYTHQLPPHFVTRLCIAEKLTGASNGL